MREIEFTVYHEDLIENIRSFVFNTVSDSDIALLSAKTSAATITAKFRSGLHTSAA